ncbi:AzlC family ABC transporter permease [Bacillota bacterium LX-D]|nr:AzlC family ABC transporter permease [Bacillota bacterium LX-D]
MESVAKVKTQVNKSNFLQGVEAGVPILMGYVPIAFTFGLLAKSLNVSATLAILMSLTNYAGASQFIGIKLMAMNVQMVEIVMTTFVVNIRHFLMSFCISKKLGPNVSMPMRALLGFGLTDENFVVASMQPDEKITPMFLLGAETISYLGWGGGTILGVVVSEAMPESMSNSIGLALYVMFLGLIIPPMKQSKVICGISFIAMFISAVLTYTPVLSEISLGFRIVLTIIITSTIGAVFFPDKEG